MALAIQFNTLFSQILNVSILTSEKKGIPPSMQTASAVEANVKDGTITPSFGFNPSAINPKTRASVPLEQHKTKLDLENKDNILLKSSETKIQFNIGKSKIISKVIDGKFPDYKKVVPQKNNKTLEVDTKDFIHSVERVITVSIDRKEGVKIAIKKGEIELFVNSSSSGEGKENLKADYNSEDLTVGFNSRYLLDIASEVQDKKLIMNLNDSVSPVLIQDNSDKNSYFVTVSYTHLTLPTKA